MGGSREVMLGGRELEMSANLDGRCGMVDTESLVGDRGGVNGSPENSRSGAMNALLTGLWRSDGGGGAPG